MAAFHTQMILHTAQPADQPRPTMWVRLATWLAMLLLVSSSVAEAGHLHRLNTRKGLYSTHAAVASTADGDREGTCLLCLLDGSAMPVRAVRRALVQYRGHTVPDTYSSRAVPLCVPFALSNRPPPAA